jgi:hypothetical protein
MNESNIDRYSNSRSFAPSKGKKRHAIVDTLGLMLGLRRLYPSRVEPHAYGVFSAAAIPSTSLGSAGVCLGNTRALVACSKS